MKSTEPAESGSPDYEPLIRESGNLVHEASQAGLRRQRLGAFPWRL